MNLDLCAGPGGVSEGFKALGLTEVGIEWDRSACETAMAAGHARIQADISTYPTEPFAGKVDILWASPPCQGFSAAGKKKGKDDLPALLDHIARCRDGWVDPDPTVWSDPRSEYVLEPLRWAWGVKPRAIGLEQVIAVRPLWEAMAQVLDGWGYWAWTGIVNAADYGVPQTRKRAILLARNDRTVSPPAPTHAKNPGMRRPRALDGTVRGVPPKRNRLGNRGRPPMNPRKSAPQFRPAYSTALGTAYQGDSRDLLRSDRVAPGAVDLIVTSPPFALTRKKAYGNEQEDAYIEWFLTFVKPFKRVLAPTGSLVIDLGGAYLPGRPQRSTYHFQLAVELAREFDLCQEFYWYNPAKLPSPAEWVNVRRMRVKDSCNLVLWLANDAANTKANNRRVLRRYSQSMEALLKNGYQYMTRPSGHDISDKFSRRNEGAIPPNLIGSATDDAGLDGEAFESLFPNLVAISNTGSNDRYQRECKARGIKAHPARFPVGVPAFFIEFLTEPGDLVLDPFAGSNTTGEAAETLGRRWVSCDLDQEGDRVGTYVRASAFRFDSPTFKRGFKEPPVGEFRRTAKTASGGGATARLMRKDVPTAKFRQVGDAVPPLLARRCLEQLL